MQYTLMNILDEAQALSDMQDTSFDITLKATDDIPNDYSLSELLAFLREDEHKIVSYTHG